MNHMMNVSTAARFQAFHIMLDWAQKNLDAETYAKIKKSYKDVIKYTLIVVLVLFIFMLAAMITAFSVRNSARSTYDTWKTGHVSGNKVWYIDNVKYEVELSDYGYYPADFMDRDLFRVYLDHNGNVIKIQAEADVNKMMEDYMVPVVMLGSLFLMISIILCIHVPIAMKTYGRIWRKYGVWFEKADLRTDTFTL